MNTTPHAVAIIGMSGLFPEADTLAQLYRNLKQGRDSVREISDTRLIHSSLYPYHNYQAIAHLDRVDLFDHGFFNISRKEAECMDPAQRLLLELACQAIEDAGYSLRSFQGTNTCVFLGGGTDSKYGRQIEAFDPAILTGNLTAMAAGRIAHYFDFRGAAMMIDTACSSSLVAVHQACQEVIREEAEVALAGGVHILTTFPRKDNINQLGTQSPDGRSKTFDATADGTGGGEGGGMVVLKRLDKALRDGDRIQAVILGSAINHDGKTSNGLTAPSPAAQTEVLTRAWQRAGIGAGTISYIEVHGTGTKLGDPIEFKGITDAFRRQCTALPHACALSALKTNIGHLDNAAGIAGLIKCVLSLKHKVIFPSLHFQAPNPFIDFENSPAYVNTRLQEWAPPGGTRRCGVSAFGITGTNAHVVLEETPPRPAGPALTGDLVLKLSAKTPAALGRYLESALARLRDAGSEFGDCLYTLNTGRDDFACRAALWAPDPAALLARLETLIAQRAAGGPDGTTRPVRVVLLLPDQPADPAVTDRLAEKYPVFKQACEQVLDLQTDWPLTEALRTLAAQYGLFRLLEASGVAHQSVIATGTGKITRQLVAGTLSLLQAARMAAGVVGTDTATLEAGKLRGVVDQLLSTGPCLFLELGSGAGTLWEALRRGPEGADRLALLPALDAQTDYSVDALLAELYGRGCPVHWHKRHEAGGRRVEVPTYPFERTRCWHREPIRQPEKAFADWLYDLRWTVQEGRPVPVAPKRWLVWTDAAGVGEALARKLRQQGHRVIAVQPGPAYCRQDPDAYVVRAGEAADYRQLAADLEVAGDLPEGIVHLGNCARREAAPGTALLEADLHEGLYAQLLLTQALDAHLGSQSVDYLLVSAHACQVTGAEPVVYAARAASLGFLRGIRGEYPLANARCVDLSYAGGESTGQLADCLLREMATAGHVVAAYRDGRRYVTELVRADAPIPAEGAWFTPERGKTYLVTGGLGGLGYEVCKELAAVPCQLLIVGRTLLPGREEWATVPAGDPAYAAVQKLRTLEANGSRVQYYAGNLADPGAADALSRRIRAGHGALHGIVHAAALPGARRIRNHSTAEFKEVFGSRVWGAVALLTHFGNDPLDFTVLFASLSGLLPGKERESDYAAGCTAVNAYAQELNRQGRRVRVINWCAWQETGMRYRLSPQPGQLVRLNKALHLRSRVGMKVFDYVLSGPAQRVFVLGNAHLFTPTDREELAHNPFFSVEGLTGAAPATPATPAPEPKAAAPVPVPARVPAPLPPGFTPTEAMLGRIWAEVLKLDAVRAEDDFFDLGGNSINGFQVITRIEKHFADSLEVDDLFEYPTLRELAARLDALGRERAEKERRAQQQQATEKPPVADGLPVYEEQEHYAVSHAQKRLWVLDQLGGNRAAYNMPAAFLVGEGLRADVLADVFRRLSDRHESLRTSFVTVGSEPRQKVAPAGTAYIVPECVDLRNDPGQDEAVRAYAAREVNTPFDLEKPPLLRIRLLQLDGGRTVLLFTMHHIISDAWSVNVLFREMTGLYLQCLRGGAGTVPPLRRQYRDYAIWQRERVAGGQLAAHRDYWMGQFTGELPVLNFPADRARATPGHAPGRRVEITLGEDLCGQLQRLAKDEKCTPFMVTLAAFKALLYRYTGQHDLVVGTPVAERGHPELENQIGLYLENLPLRTRLAPGDRFTDLLRNIKETTLQAFAHKAYPFDRLVEDLALPRAGGQFPLFDIGLTWNVKESRAGEPEDEDRLNVKSQPLPGRIAKSPVWLYATESKNRVSLSVEYDAGLYGPARMERLLVHLHNVIAAVTAAPHVTLGNLDYLDAAEKTQLLGAFNDTAAPYPSDRTLHALLEAQAQRQPDRVAVSYGDGCLTYRELDRRAAALAAHLQTVGGVQPGDLVGLLTGRSERVLIAMLAVLKAGAAYIPLDSAQPPARTGHVLRDAGVRMLLTEADLLLAASAYYQGPMVALDLEWPEPGASVTPAAVAGNATDLAYVLYTSGSTGVPKGVMVPHRGVVNVALSHGRTLGLAPADRVALFYPFSFDASVLQVFMALLAGAELLILDEDARQQPRLCLAVLRRQGVTVAGFPPAYLALLPPAELAFLRVLTSGGETPAYAHALACSQATAYFNDYGPSECSVCVTTRRVDEADRERGCIPIGAPVANTHVYLLDEAQRLVPVGVAGEICVAGEGLALGYLNNPELTEEKFVPDPFVPGRRLYKTGDLGRWHADGQLEFAGRKDRQVKVRGYRIEPAEIENALLKHPDVTQAAVVVHPAAGLVAYAAGGAELAAGALRKFLATHLPAYMIPDGVVVLAELPVTAHGKVNLKALPAPAAGEKRRAAPANATEAELLGLWQQVLGREPIGTEENFFELGGNSLKAIQLVAAIHQQWGDELKLKEVFDYPTVAALAGRIGNRPGAGIAPVEEQDYYQAAHGQKGVFLKARFEQNPVPFNMTKYYRLYQLDVPAVEEAFAQLVARHESLRTTFHFRHGTVVQRVHSPGELPFRVQHVDLTAAGDPQGTLVPLMKQALFCRFVKEEGPLLKVVLYHLPRQMFLLQVIVDHIVSDGWSMDTLVNELLALYRAHAAGREAGLPPLPVQYKDYAAWQNRYFRSPAYQAHRQYWVGKAQGQPSLVDFSAHLPGVQTPARDFSYRRSITSALPVHFRPLAADEAQSLLGVIASVKPLAGASYRAVLRPPLGDALARLGKDQQASLFAVLVTSVHLLVYALTGKRHLVMGSPVSMREREEWNGLIGWFLNTVLLAGELEEDCTAGECIRRTAAGVAGALECHTYPFERLLHDLDVSQDAISSVFVHLVNFEAGKAETLAEGGTGHRDSGTPTFDLNFTFREYSNGLELVCDYRTEIFSREAIGCVMDEYFRVLDRMIARPGDPLHAYRRPEAVAQPAGAPG